MIVVSHMDSNSSSLKNIADWLESVVRLRRLSPSLNSLPPYQYNLCSLGLVIERVQKG